MSPDGWLVLAILGSAVIAFASNRLPVDAVAMAVLLALAVSGVVSPQEAVAGFSDSSVLMIAGLFVVGQGVVSTGIAAALGTWLARAGRGSETRLIVLLMTTVASVGAFMSSTGIVAIFVPVVLSLVTQTGSSRARLMMPLSVSALISGLMTLIATAPNLVVSAALTDRGLAPLGFFELTPIGIAVLIVAIIFMTTVGRRLLDRPEPEGDRAQTSVIDLVSSYGLRGRFRAIRITPASPLAGRTVAEAVIRQRYGITVAALIRESGTKFRALPALAETVMRAGDLIAVTGESGDIDRFIAEENLTDEVIDDDMRSAALGEIGIAEVLLAPDAPPIGKSLREAAFRKRRGLSVLAIKHHGEVLLSKLSDRKLQFGDVILVAGAWSEIARLQDDPQEFVVLRLPQEVHAIAPARAKAAYALTILTAMTVIMATGLLPNVVAVLLAALAMVATGCVPAKGVYGSIGWSTLVLIAGMLPLATALQNTGVTTVMASGLTRLLADAGPYAMLSVLFLITAAVGTFVSNTATAVLIAPVAISAAQALGVSTHAFAVTVAVASSCAFVTPVSSPVNTLVLEPGRYAFNDFVKVGVPLLALAMIVTVVLVGLLYPIYPG